MQIDSINDIFKKIPTTESKKNRPVNNSENKEAHLDTVSSNIKAGIEAKNKEPEVLLEQAVEATATGNVETSHDFNMERVMRLLSDPLLKEDI